MDCHTFGYIIQIYLLKKHHRSILDLQLAIQSPFFRNEVKFSGFYLKITKLLEISLHFQFH